MSKSNTQAQVAAEVAVANAETAVVEQTNTVETVDTVKTAVVEDDANVITGIIKSFNFIPAKESKTGRSQNIAHIAVDGEDDETTLWLYDSQIENALSLKDLVALCDVCDVRERRKNVLFREATITFHYDTNEDGYENAVIDSITLARASKAAALSGIN